MSQQNPYSVLADNGKKEQEEPQQEQQKDKIVNTNNNQNIDANVRNSPKNKTWSKKGNDANDKDSKSNANDKDSGWKSRSYDNSKNDKFEKKGDWKNRSYGQKRDKRNRYKYSKIDLMQHHSPNYVSPEYADCSIKVWSDNAIAPYSYSQKNKTEITNLLRSLNKTTTNWKSSSGSTWKYDKKPSWEKGKEETTTTSIKITTTEETVKKESPVKKEPESPVKPVEKSPVKAEPKTEVAPTKKPEPEVVEEIVEPEPENNDDEEEESTSYPHELLEIDIQKIPNLHLENFWYYKAPSQELHGPYNAVKMEKWMKKGFFNVTLEVKYRNSLFVTLGEIFIELNRNPFTQEPLLMWLQKPETCNLKQALPAYIISKKGIPYLESLGFRVPRQQPQQAPPVRQEVPAEPPMYSMPQQPFSSLWGGDLAKLQEMQALMVQQHNYIMNQIGVSAQIGTNPERKAPAQNKSKPGVYTLDSTGRVTGAPEGVNPQYDNRRQAASIWDEY